MTRVNRLYQRLKRGIAFLLALILTVQPFFSFDMGLFPALAAETEGRGSTFAYYNSSNLLKPEPIFRFTEKITTAWDYGLMELPTWREEEVLLGIAWNPTNPCRVGQVEP